MNISIYIHVCMKFFTVLLYIYGKYFFSPNENLSFHIPFSNRTTWGFERSSELSALKPMVHHVCFKLLPLKKFARCTLTHTAHTHSYSTHTHLGVFWAFFFFEQLWLCNTFQLSQIAYLNAQMYLHVGTGF